MRVMVVIVIELIIIGCIVIVRVFLNVVEIVRI